MVIFIEKYTYMNNKKLIRLSESDLHRIVKESVNKILNEINFDGESLHGWYGRGKRQKDRAAQDWRKVLRKRMQKAKEIQRANGDNSNIIDFDNLGEKAVKNAM